MELQYRKNAPLTGQQVSDLRSMVGWSAMQEEYREAVSAAYMTYSCWDGELLTGFVRVASDGITEAYLQDLMVHPEYQNQGIGKHLVLLTIQELQKEGICAISLVLSPKLQRFYESLGYEIRLSGKITLQ